MELTPDELVNPAVKWIQASELISNLPVLSGAVFLTNQKRFNVLAQCLDFLMIKVRSQVTELRRILRLMMTQVTLKGSLQ